MGTSSHDGFDQAAALRIVCLRHRLDQRIAFQKLSCFCLPPVVLTLERKKLVQRAPQTLLPPSLWVQAPVALAFEADL